MGASHTQTRTGADGGVDQIRVGNAAACDLKKVPYEKIVIVLIQDENKARKTWRKPLHVVYVVYMYMWSPKNMAGREERASC